MTNDVWFFQNKCSKCKCFRTNVLEQIFRANSARTNIVVTKSQYNILPLEQNVFGVVWVNNDSTIDSRTNKVRKSVIVWTAARTSIAGKAICC